MALRNPGGLYTGGATTLNPLPYVNIALQARAKKAAKEEAINSYYTKLPSTINEKGLRDQEVPILHDLKGQIFEFGVKNREALKNPRIDNGAAQLKIEQMFRDATAVSTYSKNAAQRQLEAGKAYFGKDGWLVNDDDFIEASRRAELPVNHPDYAPLDIPKLMQNKPFDPVAFGKDIKTRFKYGEGIPTIVPHPTDKNLEVVTTNPQLDKGAKTGIYTYAADLLHSNKAFKKKIENDLKSGDQFPLLQEISRRVFGKEIENDEDIAAAYTYSQLPTSTTKAKVIPSIGAKNKEWDRRNRLTFNQSMSKIAANKAAGQPPEETGYISDNVADEVGENLETDYNGKMESRRVILSKNIDPERLNIIIGADPSKKIKGVKPVPIKMPNGTFENGYIQDPGTGDWEGWKGQKISREAAKDRYITRASPTKFKTSVNTKASENTKKVAEPKKVEIKPKSDPLKLF